MSTFSALFHNSAYSYEDAFQAKDCTSQYMRRAIQSWFDLYYDTVPTEKEDPCQRIPYTVVNKLVKTAFGEYKATSEDEFAQAVIDNLDKKRKQAVQMALIGGEAYVKPVPKKDGFAFGVIPRGNILVFGRDADGNPTDIGTVEQTVNGKYYYSLLERRTVDGNGYLTIQNFLYQSTVKDALGSRVPLGTLPQYAGLQDTYPFQQPIGLGLVRMKTPMINCVDGGPDGVSVYAAAVGLIHSINRNEAQLNGEFERGESRIIVSADMMGVDKDGKRRGLVDHVFTQLDDDPETVGVTIFSPTLREQSFLARKQEYLRNVENVIGLKRGLLSEVEAAERTATEITSSAGDYNLTIIDFQQMWENAVKDTVKLCGILGQLYKVPGAHDVAEDAVSIDFGDGVLYNREKVGQEMLQQVQQGLLMPERYLGWYYELPCDTPEERQKIREAYMPDLERLVDSDG